MSVISNDDLYRLFKELRAEAETLLKDPERAEKILDEGLARYRENKVLQDAAKDIPEMAAFAQNCIKGTYTGASESSVTAVLSAFLYFSERDDAIHDSIPVIGYVDDLSIFAFARQAADSDLKKYLESAGETAE